MTKLEKGPAGTKGVTPQSPAKAAGAPPNYSPSPKKEVQGKKSDLKKIVIVSNPDAIPYGWAFHGFYDAKEFLKHLAIRNGDTTLFGGKVYRPFSNLTTKWVPTSVFSNFIWVIRIDKDLDGTEHCFPMVPMEAHVAYGNKIA